MHKGTLRFFVVVSGYPEMEKHEYFEGTFEALWGYATRRKDEIFYENWPAHDVQSVHVKWVPEGGHPTTLQLD